MYRLLLYSKKKFLYPSSGNILIEYHSKPSQTLYDWLKTHYRVSLLKDTLIPETNVIFATVIDEQNFFPGDTVSFTCAFHMLEEEPKVINYLDAIRQTTEVQLQYGIIDSKLVSIEEIPVEKKGLRCACTCPGCGQPLIARLGEKKRKHFGHKSGSACNIEHAQQTALHMIAKEIIEQEKQFAFPCYHISLTDISWDKRSDELYALPRSLEYRKSYSAKCTSVLLEKKVSDFVPDIVVDIQGRTCLIEIAVTHFVDETKQKKISEVGLPVVEVDLSAFIGQPITREMIRDVLVTQITNKKWLYNPLKEKAIAWATAEYNKLYASALQREEIARKERQKQIEKKERREKMREKKREETAFLLQDLFEPENYKYELQHLRSDDKFQAVLRNLHLRKDIDGDIPFFLDIPITGEMVFACDRRIWQSALFDKFIYYRKMDEHENVRIGMNKIQTCLKEHMDYIPIDWKLANRAIIAINGRPQKFALLYDVVKQYLDYLHYLGFISRLSYGVASVERIKTLIPPNVENAKHLQNAIEAADKFAPDVDNQIDRILHPPYIPTYSLHRHRFSTLEPTKAETAESIEKHTKDIYATGRLQVWDCDFDNSEPIYDKFNRRWLKCKNCGAIKREDEMLSYGGRGSENKGICKNCS